MSTFTSTPSATTTASGPRPPGARTLLRIESLLFLREPVGVVWGGLLPVAAFVILGAIPGLRHPQAFLDGASFLTVYQPILILVSLAMLALNGLPPILGGYREFGVLRRLQATPMPPARLLSAQLLIHAVVAAAATAIILALGTTAFGVPLPGQFAGWVLGYLLACAAMLGLGVMIAAVSPTAKIANAIGTVSFFPLAFFAGLWMPRPTMPYVLGVITDYSPLGAAVRAMTVASAGHFPPAATLVTLTGYAVVFSVIAVRYFRW